MFKHLIMFSPYIWSIMTVTSMFIDMLFSSTLNTKDFLAPAHDLGGPKIQQSCSSRFNRVVHRYKKHASMLFMFTNTTQTLNLGKRNAGNILQHIHTLFISSTGCIKKMVHSDFSLKSIPVVGFYLFRGVLEPEFRA